MRSTVSGNDIKWLTVFPHPVCPPWCVQGFFLPFNAVIFTSHLRISQLQIWTYYIRFRCLYLTVLLNCTSKEKSWHKNYFEYLYTSHLLKATFLPANERIAGILTVVKLPKGGKNPVCEWSKIWDLAQDTGIEIIHLSSSNIQTLL